MWPGSRQAVLKHLANLREVQMLLRSMYGGISCKEADPDTL